MMRIAWRMSTRRYILFFVCFIDVTHLESYGRWIGWSKPSCDDPEISLTSTYMESDDRLEIEIGFTDHPRMLLLENHDVIITVPGITLREMEIELNFTTQQKPLLRELHKFYPNSMKISISYFCTLVNFRCSVLCDIGHRLVIMKEHSFVYESGINRSIVEMCTDGHHVDKLRNSSVDIKNHWLSLCRDIFFPKNESRAYVHTNEINEESEVALNSSAECSITIVMLVVFMNLIVIFVARKKKIDARPLNECVRRSFGVTGR
ncbi:pr152.5 [rat cytomegalovirus strain Maastricht]|uniref:Pr152.5 n=1 Tax=Rat cytomegalovirus (strain Maastricht) TaxID=79700 RepID=Q9DW36_RCMVM|nr:pr152.5 [rat cytomegalovirus strain Maastricht]AAF99254.1 pr152.5 [rat cytomegalovirus strain Maastricht]